MSTVLILGSGSDLAQSLAHVYAMRGNSIWLAGRNEQFMNTMKRDLELRYEVLCQAFYFDASQFKDHAQFLENLPSLPDTIIYVIGYLGNTKPLDTNWEETRKIFDSNLLGAISILNLFTSKMVIRKSGTIIGISSVAGDRGRQSNYLYGAAKSGFTAYLSGLRNALWPLGIRVITIKPGFMNTAMTEGLNLPPSLTASPMSAAKDVYLADTNGKNLIYTKPIWRFIMVIIRNIPEFIFKKLTL